MRGKYTPHHPAVHQVELPVNEAPFWDGSWDPKALTGSVTIPYEIGMHCH